MSRVVSSFLCVFTILCGHSIYSQTSSFFNVPAECSVALRTDLLKYASTSSEQLAYLATVDEQNYEQSKHDASASGSLVGILSASANYSDFNEKRDSLFQQFGYSDNKTSAENLLSLTTSSRAYSSFDKCMELMARDSEGFQSWRESEDLNDLIVKCHYTPSADAAAGGSVGSISVAVTVNGKSFAHFRVTPNGDCPTPIIVPRKNGEQLLVAVNAGGHTQLFTSKVGTPAPNLAVVSFTPMIQIDDTATADQADLVGTFAQGTPNMDHKQHCDSSWPQMVCDGTRQWEAIPVSLVISPPLDGDLVDPGPTKRIAFARDVAGDNGAAFCDQFSTTFQAVPKQVLPPNAPEGAVRWFHDFGGKHFVQVISRCWGPPALIRAQVTSYHIVASKTSVVAASLAFGAGDTVIFGIDTGVPATVQFSYDNGKTKDLVVPGKPSADGKLSCTKTSEFAGKTFYVYKYTGS